MNGIEILGTNSKVVNRFSKAMEIYTSNDTETLDMVVKSYKNLTLSQVCINRMII